MLSGSKYDKIVGNLLLEGVCMDYLKYVEELDMGILSTNQPGPLAWVDLACQFEKINYETSNELDKRSLLLFDATMDALEGYYRSKGSTVKEEIIENKGSEEIISRIMSLLIAITKARVEDFYSEEGWEDSREEEILNYIFAEGKFFNLYSGLMEANIARLGQAEEEIIFLLNLTDNGLRKLWWDEDGQIRASLGASHRDLRAMDLVREIKTKPWTKYPSRRLMVDIFIYVYQMLKEEIGQLDQEPSYFDSSYYTWLKIQRDFKHFDKRGQESEDLERIFSSILRIIEAEVRDSLQTFGKLDKTKAKAQLLESLPEDVYAKIMEIIGEKLADKELVRSTMLELTQETGMSWTLNAVLALDCGPDQALDLINKWRELPDYKKIINRVSSQTKDLCLKSEVDRLRVEAGLIQASPKHEPITKAWQNIQLDLEEIHWSKSQLRETEKLLEGYMGEEEEKKEPSLGDFLREHEENQESSCQLGPYGDFLKDLLKDRILESKLASYSLKAGMLPAAYISSLNQELDRHIGGQAVYLEDGYYQIDEFYQVEIEGIVNDD